LGYGDRKISKCACDLVGCVAVSVASSFTEEGDRLFAIEDADCHQAKERHDAAEREVPGRLREIDYRSRFDPAADGARVLLV